MIDQKKRPLVPGAFFLCLFCSKKVRWLLNYLFNYNLKGIKRYYFFNYLIFS